MALLRVDQVGELERIADEKHGCVVAHEVIVALLGIELDCKSTRIALGIRRALLATDGGEAGE